MGGEWRSERLGDITDLNWGDTNTTKASYVPAGFPAYSATGPDGYLPYHDFERIGVVVSAIGANCGQTWLARGKWSCIKNTIRFWSTSPDADTEYLYWITKSPDFWPRRGSAQPFISQGDARSLLVQLPPVDTQRAIADLLGSLDDKIELNRRMAETLEGMARAIFKSWFVDFDPVRAKAKGRPTGLPDDLTALFPDRFGADGLPEGWRLDSIYKFSDVIYGAPFSSDRFNSDRVGLPLIRVRDLIVQSPSIYTDEAHPNAHIVQAGDIVVGMDGEFRCHVWHGLPSYLNQRVCSFKPKATVPTSFLALALIEPLAVFEKGAVGTTVIHLGKKDIDTIRLIFLGNDVLRAFGAVSDELVNRAVACFVEARTLAALRDTLLPKLISGELRIADAEQRIAAA